MILYARNRRYSEKIEKLIAERDRMLTKYNSEIIREIEKEEARYSINWKRVVLFIAMIVYASFAFFANEKLFPKTSIWSWEYYITDFYSKKD